MSACGRLSGPQGNSSLIYPYTRGSHCLAWGEGMRRFKDEDGEYSDEEPGFTLPLHSRNGWIVGKHWGRTRQELFLHYFPPSHSRNFSRKKLCAPRKNRWRRHFVDTLAKSKLTRALSDFFFKNATPIHCVTAE